MGKLTLDPSDDFCVLGVAPDARVTARYVLQSVIVSSCIFAVSGHQSLPHHRESLAE